MLVTLGILALVGFGLLTLLGGILSGLQDRWDQAVPPTVQPTSLPTPDGQSEPPPDPESDPDPEPGEWDLPERSWPEIPPATSSDPNWTVVQTSELYLAEFPAHTGCPPPALAYEYPEMEAYIAQQMSCIQGAWEPVQAQLGYSTADIPVYFFQGQGISSGCGYVEAPAFYCSADGGAIYFGQGTLDWGTFQPFGMKDMAAHEFGHHLQAQAGFFDAMYYLGWDNEIIRRSELQATCLGQGMIGRDDSFVMDQEHYAELARKHQQVAVDGTHGTNASNDFWGFRGLYAASLAECNTWTSPSSDVE